MGEAAVFETLAGVIQMSVFNALNTAIYGKLSAGTALTGLLGGTAIYYQQAPDKAAVPYVVWSYQSGGYENLTPREMWSGLAWVRVYAATPALAGSVDIQIHALLHEKALTVTGWTNFWLVREADFENVETLPNDVKVHMAGGMYRIRLSE